MVGVYGLTAEVTGLSYTAPFNWTAPIIIIQTNQETLHRCRLLEFYNWSRITPIYRAIFATHTNTINYYYVPLLCSIVTEYVRGCHKFNTAAIYTWPICTQWYNLFMWWFFSNSFIYNSKMIIQVAYILCTSVHQGIHKQQKHSTPSLLSLRCPWRVRVSCLGYPWPPLTAANCKYTSSWSPQAHAWAGSTQVDSTPSILMVSPSSCMGGANTGWLHP